ncbi:adenosine deaminase [Actinopolyspora xinjiangensis]|uniref:adenosine deaminase n=1 Tax=Actinopolyspora xinjiangensis TaxID=405564 RepID=A0A1H0QDM1_9ACTN|nr:adenosine deaminase [Actinopolyspora xinjiangensis]SDP15491.1 adenosine deaminase [Actinopolyspora xinjiangensis]
MNLLGGNARARTAGRRRRATGTGGIALAALLTAASLPVLVAQPRPAQAETTPGERAPACAPWDRECRVNRYLDRIRDRPEKLDEFLRTMPKGGDLHNHLSGAVSTESLIRYAAEDGRCIDAETMQSSLAPCTEGQRPASDAVSDPEFRERVIGAWSMAGFEPGGEESGHDHFFATFGKFWAATEGRDGDMLAEVAGDLAEQNQFYLETLLSRQYEARSELVERVGFDPSSEREFRRLREVLLREGLRDVERAARRQTDRDFARYRELLNCGTPSARPGCGVEIRLDYQVARANSPASVFTQLLLGFELAQSDPRFVGLNMVQPEDHEVSLRDYTLHMRMIDYLSEQYPGVSVSLHAGELVPGLVKPEELTHHIDQAVRIAGADRIGHGIDLRHEDDWRALADHMAERDIPVEVPLTSNCQILRVCGSEEHPLPDYMAHDVPYALATDDPGVSRSDITAQYSRAATEFGLSYSQLKASARTSLEHAFIQGESLWAKPGSRRMKPVCASDTPGFGKADTAACAELLSGSPKAKLQWRQEAAFHAFETYYAAKL